MTSEPDIKITVICFIKDKGVDFCGIYSNDDDAERIALDNVSRGDVICVRYEQTVTESIPIERGVYATNPLVTIHEYTPKRFLN